LLRPQGVVGVEGVEDLQPYFFSTDVECVNPTPIVLLPESRFLPARGVKDLQSKFFLADVDTLKSTPSPFWRMERPVAPGETDFG
jgi:hypothetical protein